jgi:4-amino-4-deoxy-L-arabinose transferase-like glycosyltransferase
MRRSCLFLLIAGAKLMIEQPSVPDEPLIEIESKVEQLPAEKNTLRDKLWAAYMGTLLISGLGLVITRSSIFPMVMFLATTIYLGLQLSVQLRHFRALNLSVGPQAEQIRTLVAPLTTAFALILMVWSAYLFRATPVASNELVPGVLVMLIGGITLTIGLFFNSLNSSAEKPLFIFSSSTNPFPGSYSLLTVLGILLLLIESEISGNSFKIQWLQSVSYWIQGFLFVGGIGLVVVGMAGTTGLSWLRRTIQRIRERDLWWLAIIAVVVLAFVLRVWDLENSLPLSIDDGMNIPSVWRMLADRVDTGLLSDDTNTTQLYPWLLGLSVRIFGYNFVGARMVDAVLGTFGVIALFILADALFNRKVALLAALIFATFPPHLHFSRLMFSHMGDATFGTFAIAFLARAMKYNRRSDWVLAGAGLGLSQYFFEAGRLFFPPLIAIWLGVIALFNFKRIKQFAPGFGVFIITTLLVVMPAYYGVFANNRIINTQLNRSGVGLDYWMQLWNSGDTQYFFNRILSPFLVYVHQPEIGLLYYGGFHPMILEYFVPFFLIGFFYLLWWWKSPTIIVSLWAFATAGANLFLLSAENYTRYIVGFPALALAIAVGIYYVVPMLLPMLKRQITLGLTIALVGIICVAQTVYYFNVQLPDLRYQLRTMPPYPDSVDVALRLTALPPNTHAFMISTYPVDQNIPNVVLSLYLWNKPEMYWLNTLTPDQVTPEFVSALPIEKNYAFFIESDHPEIVEQLKQVFVLDEPQYTNAKDMPAGKGFILYFASLNKQAQPAAK